MSHPGNGTVTDPNAGTPGMMVPSDSLDKQLTITTASRVPSTKVPKTSKPWKNTRAIVAGIATGTAIAVALWFSYFATRIMVRAIKGRRYRRQAGM